MPLPRLWRTEEAFRPRPSDTLTRVMTWAIATEHQLAMATTNRLLRPDTVRVSAKQISKETILQKRVVSTIVSRTTAVTEPAVCLTAVSALLITKGVDSRTQTSILLTKVLEARVDHHQPARRRSEISDTNVMTQSRLTTTLIRSNTTS
jgi:hypothetical protein